ncbi:hypothetical protein BOX15_Mlig021640g1, partial [Macrostomum lignano]
QLGLYLGISFVGLFEVLEVALALVTGVFQMLRLRFLVRRRRKRARSGAARRRHGNGTAATVTLSPVAPVNSAAPLVPTSVAMTSLPGAPPPPPPPPPAQGDSLDSVVAMATPC